VQRRTVFTAAVLTAVALPLSASAALPFSYWTVKQASARVVALNPQGGFASQTTASKGVATSDDTTMIRASHCRGLDSGRVSGGVRRYQWFGCGVLVRDNTHGFLFSTNLYFITSKIRKLAVACTGERLQDLILLGCADIRPPQPQRGPTWNLRTEWNPHGDSLWHCPLEDAWECARKATVKVLTDRGSLANYVEGQAHLNVGESVFQLGACEIGFESKCDYKITSSPSATFLGQFVITWKQNGLFYESHFDLWRPPTCIDDRSDAVYGCPLETPPDVGTFSGNTPQGQKVTLTVGATMFARWAWSVICPNGRNFAATAYPSGPPSFANGVWSFVHTNAAGMGISATYNPALNTWAGSVRNAYSYIDPPTASGTRVTCDTGTQTFTAAPGP
jgi:hypothetical protein